MITLRRIKKNYVSIIEKGFKLLEKVSTNLRLLGSTTVVGADREQHDFYATEPKAVELLLDEEEFQIDILEPCCGMNHITDVLRSRGYQVHTSDLIDRGVGA